MSANKIRMYVGGAESYRLSVTDRNNEILDLASWFIKLSVLDPATNTYTQVDVPLDPEDSHYALVPIEGDVTATAGDKEAYVEVRHPSGKPVDGVKFEISIEDHP